MLKCHTDTFSRRKRAGLFYLSWMSYTDADAAGLDTTEPNVSQNIRLNKTAEMSHYSNQN